MPIRSQIKDGHSGTGNRALVTKLGQLITAPVSYDLTQFNKIDVADTGYNYYETKPGKDFIVTGIRIKADRNVSNTVAADVVVYTAFTPTDTAADMEIHQENLIRSESATLFPLNIRVEEGNYINVKASDTNFYVTVTGYYIDKLG